LPFKEFTTVSETCFIELYDFLIFSVAKNPVQAFDERSLPLIDRRNIGLSIAETTRPSALAEALATTVSSTRALIDVGSLHYFMLEGLRDVSSLEDACGSHGCLMKWVEKKEVGNIRDVVNG
jgi:hypothetical protein